ncbi:uncharacterized protein LOC127751799 [Frankliniella occidentalis]|uniref:Uncharacterized protein LOC127751799 n=1 Tax=Frankliniella occidentalis TaxID=133901 RepID=A0A9C6X9T8_FRAOC|nr:uncharacterized protein LOC127751799 [Frankliniella occidentalis]
MDPVETSVLNLQQLPDDVLVMVMQYLDVEDVLACRLVCKRLCGLALDRDIWRHRSFDDDDSCAGVVLRLAPCLDTLTLTDDVPTTTRCSVAHLILRPYDTFNAAGYASAVRLQESYGRLRSLELYCSDVGLKTTNDVLLRTVVSCSDLESLGVFGQLPRTSPPVLQGPPRSSLKNFQYEVYEYSPFFVHTILTAHAATLEKVDLSSGFSIEDTTTTALLAALPRLKSLRCNASMADLEAVAACRTLRDISIYLGESNVVLQAAAKFFRRANQLRSVCLPYGEPDETAVLVEALASSGRSQLERLYLRCHEDVTGTLVRALPALPALRHLDFSEVTPDDDKLLLSITPATAPALRTMEFGCWGRCPHPWIHRAAVKATLAANTSLHILLGYGPICVLQNCGACVAGCHQQVNWREGGIRKIGLFAHDQDKCPSPDVHTDHSNNGNQWNRGGSLKCTWIHM